MYYTIASITPLILELTNAHKTIVLATGFFDLLHTEHITFLQRAKAAGDVLIVAVESDARARSVKGEGRPVEPQAIRCQKVGEYADYVIGLSDDFDNPAAYESLMSAVRPSIYAVSSHTSYQDLKNQLTQKYGGKLVVVHEFNANISTTQIISSQKQI
jgi:cytidyltransferase-like protein